MSLFLRSFNICINKLPSCTQNVFISRQFLPQSNSLRHSRLATSATLNRPEPANEKKDRILTIPNLLCVSRWVSSVIGHKRYKYSDDTAVKDRRCSLHRSPYRQWQLPAGVRRVRLRRGHGPPGRLHRQELQEPSLQPRQLPRSSVRQNISR